MTSAKKKTVVVLGKGSLAIAIADWFQKSADHELHCVVPAIPEPAWAESLLRWCKQQGVTSVDSGDYQEIPGLHDTETTIDLVISVYYGKIIKPRFFECVGRTLNLHNAPLPRYRGCNPINWALKNGETTHGVTIHDMVERVDAGPIVSQVRFPIDPETDEVIDVYNRALACGYDLFLETISSLDKINPHAQNDADVSYYSRTDAINLGDRRSFTRVDSSPEAIEERAIMMASERTLDASQLRSRRRREPACELDSSVKV